jgi:hypothetical protein
MSSTVPIAMTSIITAGVVAITGVICYTVWRVCRRR